MPREAAGAGWIRGQYIISIILPSGTGAFEAITDHNPNYKRTIEGASVFVMTPATGAGATRTIRVIKNAATVVASGTITLANLATAGAEVALTVVAADADFLDSDTFTVDLPAGGTAFTGGIINLIINNRQRMQQR